jgi:hypothetical protein
VTLYGEELTVREAAMFVVAIAVFWVVGRIPWRRP